MELKVIHLLLILIGVIILGYFGYKAGEGFANTPAVNLSCVPTDASGSVVKESSNNSSSIKGSGSAMDPSGQMVSMTSLLGLTGAPPTDNGSMSSYLQNVQNMVHSEFLSHALNVPDSTTNTSNTTIGPISETQELASLKCSDANALQGIQKIVHNALLNQKGMTTGAQMAFLGQKAGSDTGDEEYEEDDSSPSNYQGKEYTKDCPKNSGKPDMSKYIRKDSIPCWGCNVE
jgi:hypothetical protein